jgi:cyclic beta-1,2-glucan synthetase
VEGILGLRREGGMLCVDPCIPPEWSGFEAWVRVGAQRVHIVVDNQGSSGAASTELTLDGVPQDSKRVALDANATGTREVHVRLGCAGTASSRAAE